MKWRQDYREMPAILPHQVWVLDIVSLRLCAIKIISLKVAKVFRVMYSRRPKKPEHEINNVCKEIHKTNKNLLNMN